MRLILASKSPRRREIFDGLGIKYEILTKDTDEVCDITDPQKKCEAIAKKKALAVLDMLKQTGDMTSDTYVIGADTLVYVDGEFLGKPTDREDARRMIRMLSSKTHGVYTAVAIAREDKVVCGCGHSLVTFSEMSEKDIEYYLDTDEPYDKAGAYAVQGKAAMFIEKIEGDYLSIVGLSPKTLGDTFMRGFGISLTSLIKGEA